MPANPKYLTSSGWQRFAKISAGFLGGYLVSASLHMALALWLPDHKIILITSVYTLFLVWMVFMILPFFSKNGWRIWGYYLVLIFVFSTLAYWGDLIHPILDL